jgi:hypothetical protein
MTNYLLAAHMSDEAPSRSMTDEEMRRGFAQVEAIERDLKAADALMFTGRLVEAARARVVRPVRNRIKVTDGPYAETKEQLGGFYIIEASDPEAALAWASRVATAINAPIEVRAFLDDPREQH